MATFTHTVTWVANIEGKSTTYTFTYDVEDVDDIERFTSGRQNEVQATFRSEPVLSAVLVSVAPGTVRMTETAGPTSFANWNVNDGDLLVFHQSDSGGTFNTSASNATTTLRVNDSITAGGVTYQHAGYDILALHQPAS